MTMLPGLLFVALFAVVGPLIDYSVFGPAYRRLWLALREGSASGDVVEGERRTEPRRV